MERKIFLFWSVLGTLFQQATFFTSLVPYKGKIQHNIVIDLYSLKNVDKFSVRPPMGVL